MAQDVRVSTSLLPKVIVSVKEPLTASTSPGKRGRYDTAMVYLVVAALVVRIGFMIVLGSYRFDLPDDRSDVNEQTLIARSIAQGHGFSSPFSETDTGPTAWVTPVYPYFIALVFKHYGVMSWNSYKVIQAVQSLFSALTVLPLMGILSLAGSRRSGIGAAVLWAFFPWFSRWAVTWIWETSLSALLVGCVLWYAVWLGKREGSESGASARHWIGFGALWGFTLLVNPALGSLLPITLGYGLYERHRHGRAWLRPAVAALAVCFLTISPWLVRNRVEMGHWLFLRDNFGFEFALGNYHGSLGRGWGGKHPTGNPHEFARYRQLGEVAYIQESTAQAMRFVRHDPGEFLSLCVKRALYFWDGSGMEYRGPVAAYWLPWSFAWSSFLLLPALLISGALELRAWRMFFLTIALYPIPYYLTHPPIRYRHMIEPVMVLLIAFAAIEGGAWLVSRFRKDGRESA